MEGLNLNPVYLALTILVMVGGVVVSRHQHERSAGRRWFLGLSFVLAVWIAAEGLGVPEPARPGLAFLSYASGMYALTFLILFLRNIFLPRQRGTSLPLLTITTAALATYYLSGSLVHGPTAVLSEAIYLGFPLALFGLIFLSIAEALDRAPVHKRPQLVAIGLSSVLAAALGLITNLFLPLFDVSGYVGFGILWIIVSFVVVTLALLVRRRSRQAVMLRRTTVHNLAVGSVLTLCLGIVLFGSQVGIELFIPSGAAQTTARLGMVALAAFTIAPFKYWISQLTKHWLFRSEQLDQEALRQMTQELLRSSDLYSVLTTYMKTVSERLGVEGAACYVFTKADGDSSLRVKQIVPLGEVTEELPALDENDPAMRYLTEVRSIVSYHLLASEVEHEEFKLRHMAADHPAEERRAFVSEHTAKMAVLKLMESLQAETLAPLIAKDTLFGLIFLSPKTSGQLLSFDEQRFLELATAETITSIQRANFFEGDLQKTEFISIASHELRTPLTAIRGYLSMMLDEKLAGNELDHESQAHLQESYTLTKQLIAMVNDLLTLSRLESGRTQLHAEQTDLIEVIKEVVKKLHPQAMDKKVHVRIDNKRSVPHAWVDPEGMRVVLTNLIGNAIAYNREGGRVRIKVHSHPTEGSVSIEILDTGIGMKPEQMTHLFEKFYRVETRETKSVTGTGLGLNITQTYLKKMGGSIVLHSRYHRGTTSLITVPLFTPEKLREQAANSSQELADQREDIPVGLILLSSKLSGEPYNPQDLALLEVVGHQAITTIQRAKLYEGDQMKTQFVSVASHELLTPISAVEGYVGLVLQQHKDKMEPKTLEFIRNIDSSIRRLSTLVKDLLSVSRLESGRITITATEFDVHTAIRDTLVQLEFVAKDKNIVLREKSGKELPPAFADPERTAQVLMNLVGNAIKYNKDGGTVEIGASEETPGFITISVSDNGIGMTNEQMSHLFEKFYRVDSSETTGIVGTGLGLYITKSMVERMGGTITVKSGKNQGSTFSFTLPVVGTQPNPQVATPSDPLEPIPTPAPERATIASHP